MPTIAAWILAVAAGVSVVVQQALNAHLKGALSSAAWAGVVSYLVGTTCMVLFAAWMRDPLPAGPIIGKTAWWAWFGGMFGAIYIGLAIVLVPQLGAATFIALLVGGQMAASLAFDHFGAFGLEQRPVDPGRLLGVVLLVAGVVLIRR
jgi:transporter family-2 protein